MQNNDIIILSAATCFLALVGWLWAWGEGIREYRLELERIKAQSCAVVTQQGVNPTVLEYCPDGKPRIDTRRTSE